MQEPPPHSLPEPPSSPGPYCHVSRPGPQPREAGSPEVGRGKWGLGNPRRRRKSPSRALSSAVPLSLPKSLEKILDFPASQPLKEWERDYHEPSLQSSGFNTRPHQFPKSSRFLHAAILTCLTPRCPPRALGPASSIPQSSASPRTRPGNQSRVTCPKGQSQSHPPLRPEPRRLVRAHFKNQAGLEKKGGERGPATLGFTGARSSGLRALGQRLGQPGAGRGSRHQFPPPLRFL